MLLCKELRSEPLPSRLLPRRRRRLLPRRRGREHERYTHTPISSLLPSYITYGDVGSLSETAESATEAAAGIEGAEAAGADAAAEEEEVEAEETRSPAGARRPRDEPAWRAGCSRRARVVVRAVSNARNRAAVSSRCLSTAALTRSRSRS
jgi:hypothetical protein